GAGVLDRCATAQPVGRLQADGPDAAVADLLGDLGPHLDGRAVDLDGHRQAGVDLREGVGRELDVDHRAGDGDDPAVLGLGFGLGEGHDLSPEVDAKMESGMTSSIRRSSPLAPAWRRASAPPTISMISVVMESWRARFITRLRRMIMSSAFSDADFMARCCEAKNEAVASSRAANSRASAYRGSSRSRISDGLGSNS